MLTELEQRANDEARHAHRELLEKAARDAAHTAPPDPGKAIQPPD